MSDYSSDDVTVTPNAILLGQISGVERQVDVLIDRKWDDDSRRRIIVDAKRYNAKIDVKDIESFKAMMEDCRADHGIVVCPNGFTPAAKRRAQDAITIKLVPLEDLEGFDLNAWDPCLGSCNIDYVNKHKYGLVLYDSPYLLERNSLFSIMTVGKCDRCHEFHVWCWECGEKFALKDID